jgi:hypothetical protein
MSTNHNRIKVADLETNQPDKILKTNAKGELEFTNANLQSETYNALDCTTEGKVLDARQGKVLKEMIENNTVNIASDSETQIESPIPEDYKVVSRSKLFNWWDKIKTKTQTIKAVWNFNLGIKVNNSSGNYTYSTEMGEEMFTAKMVSTGYGTIKTEYGWGAVRWFLPNGLYTKISALTPTQNNSIALPDKSGTMAITNDFVKTAAGTTTTPSLIIPNGTLTTVPQNGAIERDLNGELYQVVSGKRYKIIDNRDFNSFLTTTWRSTNTNISYIPGTYTNSTASKTVPVSNFALGSSDQGNYLFKTFDSYLIKNGNYSSNLFPPKSVSFEVFLKGNNCKFSGNEYVRLYSVQRTDTTTDYSIRNYEIPLQTNLSEYNDIIGSVLMFSETTFDNFGNIISENYKKYFLQSLDYTGNYSDIKFSNASISIEYRVSVQYDDVNNQNSKNVYARPIFNNYSSLFLKI